VRSRPAHRAEPLRARRRAARRRLVIALVILFFILVGAGFYALWQPFARIQRIDVSGPHADASQIPAAAQAALTGTYFHIVPKDSIFFFPKESVRQAVLAAYPDVTAVSVSRASLDAIRVTALGRTEAFVWCGEAYSAATSTTGCYSSDAEGFLYQTADVPPLPVYAALAASSTPGIGAQIGNAGAILGMLQFDRAAATLGARVVALELNGDEANLYTSGGTRITYVAGQESAAAALAAASFRTLDLNSGSIEYVDLRFSGKVYYKNKGG
jgi:cell division septal protein FtsQ